MCVSTEYIHKILAIFAVNDNFFLSQLTLGSFQTKSRFIWTRNKQYISTLLYGLHGETYQFEFSSQSIVLSRLIVSDFHCSMYKWLCHFAYNNYKERYEWWATRSNDSSPCVPTNIFPLQARYKKASKRWKVNDRGLFFRRLQKGFKILYRQRPSPTWSSDFGMAIGIQKGWERFKRVKSEDSKSSFSASFRGL